MRNFEFSASAARRYGDGVPGHFYRCTFKFRS
jgi:hypothetical protein